MYGQHHRAEHHCEHRSPTAKFEAAEGIGGERTGYQIAEDGADRDNEGTDEEGAERGAEPAPASAIEGPHIEEAPVNLGYSQRNRSAAVRIPMYSANPKAKRVEFRCPDPACNPYLAFAAMLMAGLDGIQNRINPGDPIDKNLYDLPPVERAKIRSTPGSLDEALDALEADHQFLLKGDVFTKDAVEIYINYKRSREIDEIRLRPHPYEFFLYYDI